eukprot:26045_1
MTPYSTSELRSLSRSNASAALTSVVYYRTFDCMIGSRNSLEFVVRSFSGTVVFADECTAEELKDDSITHQVVDRPIVDESIASREYVQPQWIFDSVNERHLLPVGPYGPGKQVPAHLSTFVDHEKTGYVPTEVDERKRWVGGANDIWNVGAETPAPERKE